MTDPVGMPDPAVVVLIGPTGSGKSTWAAARYRRDEIVSSDDLRAVVGTGPHDLDASTDAFAVLDQIVAARIRRGLTTVIDTLGLETTRGRATCWRPAPAECRARNSRRDRPVPASAVDGQLRTMRTVQAGIADEGWDVVQHFGADAYPESPYATGTLAASRLQHESPSELEFILQVSQFPWGDDPAGWLISIVTAAERADSPASPSWTTSSRSRRSAGRGIRFPSRG